MTADVIALRAHLVAEVEYAKRIACHLQGNAHGDSLMSMSRHTPPTTPVRMHLWQRDASDSAETARTATDAWLAADARLRALDGLIAAVSPRTQG